MSRFVGWKERVSLMVYDVLIEREGVRPMQAALIGQAVLKELEQDGQLRELYVVKVVDSSGEPHAVVTREPSDLPQLWRFDTLKLGRRARQSMAEMFRVDLATNHAGTEI